MIRPNEDQQTFLKASVEVRRIGVHESWGYHHVCTNAQLCRSRRRKKSSTSALLVRGFDGCRTIVRSQKSELNFCEAVAHIFDRASLEAEPLGHHSQTAPQLFVALFDVISNFAAFECRDHWVGNSPPS
jgi:hypothetical protein